MTQNEENFIKKINELQNIIEWQKKVIAQRDDELSIQTSIMEAMEQRIKELELPKNNGIASLDIQKINASKMMGIIK